MTPFHIWGSLVEKAGFKMSDIPNKWDAFIDFFKPVQKKLQAQGMRHTYAYGFVVGTVGIDPINTSKSLHDRLWRQRHGHQGRQAEPKDPKVQEAVVKAMDKLATIYKDGYNPPSSINWNDADDNNAFHSKLA